MLKLLKEYLFWKKKRIEFILLPFFLTKPRVKTINETLDFILENKASLSRFGDGELYLMHKGYLGFQKSSSDLSDALWEVFAKDSSINCAICVQGILNGFDPIYRNSVIAHWTKHLYVYGRVYYKYRGNKTNYDTCVTRLYSQFNDRSNVAGYFGKWKRVFDNRELLIVEGELTRFGIGNDLIASAKSVERILCPAENAFDVYSKILSEIRKYSQQKLVLVALGPTATLLAYHLSLEGFQVIDIGHLDIEYEWFINKVEYKAKVKNKYVNEQGGANELNETFVDPIYDSQIVSRISNN